MRLTYKQQLDHESLHNPLTHLGNVTIDSSPKRCPRNFYIPYVHQWLAQLFRAQLPLLGLKKWDHAYPTRRRHSGEWLAGIFLVPS
jgi:hypothetical protein